MEHLSNIKVLMYHRILPAHPEQPTGWHYVTEDQFRWQMQILDRLNFTPVTFADYSLSLGGTLTLPQKPIILTFDDGYLDTYDRALPILESYGMKGVIYVMGPKSDGISVTAQGPSWSENGKHDPCLLMGVPEMISLSLAGHEIGSHGITHRPLSELTEGEIRYEMQASKQWLESILNREILSISYPYGAVDSRVLRCASEAGYRFACGVYTGPANFLADPYDIRRLAIDHRLSPMQFLLRLLTPFEYAEWAYRQVRAGSRIRHTRTTSREAEIPEPLS